jgi:D-aminopeptidase
MNAGTTQSQPGRRAREVGVRIGVLPAGRQNAITDVGAVRVGHTTLVEGDAIRTGVTAIIPSAGNLFQRKVPGAVYVGNGFGKLAGSTQVEELGTIETPIVLTNTLAVAAAIEAVVEHALAMPGNESVRSVNALVGETNDGELNDIRGRHVRPGHVRAAIDAARGGPVEEGNVGAGTGTVCFGFKGGIGTSSRVLPEKLGGFAVGVLVQSNFGGVLQIAGVPVGESLGRFSFRESLGSADGSCMIVVATDAPLDARNLKRLGQRAFMGLAKTGGIAANGSGDYAIAFSTADALRVDYRPASPLRTSALLHDDFISPLFLAAIEATEEAIVNSLFAARTMTGVDGRRVEALPLDPVLGILHDFNRLHP